MRARASTRLRDASLPARSRGVRHGRLQRRRWSRATATCPATTAARPRCATCSPSTASRSPRRWRSGSAPAPASTTSRSTASRRRASPTGASPARGAVRRAHRRRRSRSRPSTTPRRPGRRRGTRSTRAPGAAAHRPLLPRPLRQLGALPRPRGGPRRLRRRGRLPLRHRLRGAADDARSRTSPRRATATHPDLPARRPHVRPCPTGAELGDPRGRGAGGDRAQRQADARAADWASSRACRRCAGSPPRSATGREQVEDWQWCARFGYQVIERRGTGGGNFRLMYSRFLAEVGHDARRRWPPRRRRAGRRSPGALLRGERGGRARPAALGAGRRGGRGGARGRGAPLAGARSRLAASSRRTARSIFSRSTNSSGSCRRRSASAGLRIVSPAVVAVEHARVDVGAAADRGCVVEVARDPLGRRGRRALARRLRLRVGPFGASSTAASTVAFQVRKSLAL